MSPRDGSRQKLRNSVYICKRYAEKNRVASFSGHSLVSKESRDQPRSAAGKEFAFFCLTEHIVF